mmetsp:Transcript_9826/g.33309  ORF Transcript_9826/g.33309 Transcript_9826/m.33309 type:complete len:249 (+) Transcript_9826:425-1171(+)
MSGAQSACGMSSTLAEAAAHSPSSRTGTTPPALRKSRDRCLAGSLAKQPVKGPRLGAWLGAGRGAAAFARAPLAAGLLARLVLHPAVVHVRQAQVEALPVVVLAPHAELAAHPERGHGQLDPAPRRVLVPELLDAAGGLAALELVELVEAGGVRAALPGELVLPGRGLLLAPRLNVGKILLPRCRVSPVVEHLLLVLPLFVDGALLGVALAEEHGHLGGLWLHAHGAREGYAEERSRRGGHHSGATEA